MKSSKMIAKSALILLVAFVVSACGSKHRSVAMKLHSDPQGAYALMQVKQKGNEDADWIYLGPTPIVTTRKVSLKGASTVSLKVIRPGFYEQVKTWTLKDFVREHKDNKEIVWVPNMVKQ